MTIVVERRLGIIGSTFVKYGLGYGAAAAMILSYTSVAKYIIITEAGVGYRMKAL